MRGEVAFVELHAFEQFDGGFEGLTFFDGDDAVFADFVHRLCEGLADFGVLIGRAGCDLFDLFAGLDGNGHLLKLGDDSVNGLVDAALDLHGVCAGGDIFEAFVENRLGQDGRGGGSVAGDIAGFGGDFFDHLRAHVFIGVGQLDFLCDGHAVFGDSGRAIGFFEDDVSAAWAECNLDGAGQFANAFADGRAGIRTIGYFFSCHIMLSPVFSFYFFLI